MLIGVKEYGCPHLLFVKLLNAQDVLFVVIVDVKVGSVEFAILQHNENRVVAMEFTKIIPTVVIIQALHIMVEPHLTASQCATALRLQRYLMNLILRKQIASRLLTLHHNLREIAVEENLLEFAVGLQRNLNDLSLTIGISGEVMHLTSWCTSRYVILTIVGNTRNVKSLNEILSVLTVAIHHVVNRACIVALKHGYVNNFSLFLFGFRARGFANEDFFLNARHLVRSVAVEDNHIVDVRTVAHKFILLKARTDKAIHTIDVKFFVGFNHL